VPAKPEVGFEGLVVDCEVLECDPPRRLVFSWSAGGPVVDTRVSFQLEPEGSGTRLVFEHSGFDLAHPFGKQAFAGADHGWASMLERLTATVAGADAALRTSRLLPAPQRQVFAAFEQAAQLARWWGPEGFTNTFEQFEFRHGGRWVYVMHGPDGADYPNESVFREIEPDTRIVIEHVALPRYRLTVTLAAENGRTRLTWEQVFENTTFATKMRDFLATANEQNLDRLQTLLAHDHQ
jgi:uncharacterized protein YndB with AHSA1/START domain